MGDTLITKDGKRHLICRDTHFEELLRDYLGDDAAQWYRERIGRIDSALDAIEWMRGMDDFDLPRDDLIEIAQAVKDIPGWDE